MNKAITKRQMIAKIGKRTKLNYDVVEEVIDAFQELFVEEVLTTGKFNLTNCFSVATEQKKERVHFNIHTKQKELHPAGTRLKIKLSNNITHVKKWQQSKK